MGRRDSFEAADLQRILKEVEQPGRAKQGQEDVCVSESPGWLTLDKRSSAVKTLDGLAPRVHAPVDVKGAHVLDADDHANHWSRAIVMSIHYRWHQHVDKLVIGIYGVRVHDRE
eukprot:CAMPEP_0179431264 /NCGR_PEP_ID=MMETSP0799-20121207/16202_1 /TAXON_ID=46947 /ORGANISM="Geminigera cryophila, Strain CCMP2564" /LENGTH=113 /DNA_ID=CAMNT_0021208117 /DNA_START=518 /DNA_END=859 /DNA_ORIENTATION=-